MSKAEPKPNDGGNATRGGGLKVRAHLAIITPKGTPAVSRSGRQIFRSGDFAGSFGQTLAELAARRLRELDFEAVSCVRARGSLPPLLDGHAVEPANRGGDASTGDRIGCVIVEGEKERYRVWFVVPDTQDFVEVVLIRPITSHAIIAAASGSPMWKAELDIARTRWQDVRRSGKEGAAG